MRSYIKDRIFILTVGNSVRKATALNVLARHLLSSSKNCFYALIDNKRCIFVQIRHITPEPGVGQLNFQGMGYGVGAFREYDATMTMPETQGRPAGPVTLNIRDRGKYDLDISSNATQTSNGGLLIYATSKVRGQDMAQIRIRFVLFRKVSTEPDT